MSASIALRASSPNPSSISIVKSSRDLIIAGYASVEMVDKQGDLITRGALKDAFGNFMKAEDFRNVQLAHSNIQVGSVISDYTDSNGRVWKSGVDDAGMFVVIKLRDDIEKAREVANEIRKGNLTGFSIGGQAFKRINKADAKHGNYTEISKLELHEVTICEKGINPEASFRILKEDTTMTETDALTDLSEVIDRLSKKLDGMDPDMKDMDDMDDMDEEEEEDEKPRKKKLPPMSDDFMNADDDDDSPDDKKDSDEDKKEMKNMNDKTEKSDGDYSDVITSEYLNWMENTLKSAGVDINNARNHFDDVTKANLGSTPEQFPVEQMSGQVAGRASEGGSPSTSAISAAGLGSGAVAKSYLHPEEVSPAEIEKAYEVYKAAAIEEQFKGNLSNVFSDRLSKELNAEAEHRAASEFDARAPLSNIEKAIAELGERIESLGNTESVSIQKSIHSNSQVEIPSTEDLAGMSWDEVHSLAGSVWQ